MRIAFHFRSVLAPMLGVLLAAPSPAEANEGVAVFSDPAQIAGSAAPSPRSSTLGEESHLVAGNSTSYYPKAALKVTDVAYMRQLPAEGVLSVNPSNMLALHGSGAKEAADVLKKSNGPFIELPGHHRHKGILERSASSARARRRCQAQKFAAEMDAKVKAAEKQTATIMERKRILLVLSPQGSKILAAGSDTAGDGIIKRSIRARVSRATSRCPTSDRHCQGGCDSADEECRVADLGGRAVREPLHRHRLHPLRA
ncbi:hypothetical protein [Mesorhizobium sangaii]|uniref:ABC-type hemin transport system substrate-binding protein n=1 Tax=Mesorhizobium sangaii TaxID=505389 RepID=A0A841PFE6_9HYPH|nr:hypothetical protein [Mesorhizobium sangaii]MBB6413917.1 ABC-type hemin transport system substrate-binding protein [Mesorhizobium sangaii]